MWASGQLRCRSGHDDVDKEYESVAPIGEAERTAGGTGDSTNEEKTQIRECRSCVWCFGFKEG